MQRVKELDGLRGLAVLTVVAYHVWPRWITFGWAAVDLFFVLSGYLITAICLNGSKCVGFLRTFYLRRGLRIWPIYYMLIFILFMFGDFNASAVPYYLTYAQEVPRYWKGVMPPWRAMEHAWTLAIEEQFYLLWPGLIMIAGQKQLRTILAAFLLAALIARCCGIPQWTLLTSGDGLALGSLLALLRFEAEASARQGMIGRSAVVAASAAAMLLAIRVAIRRSPWVSAWPNFAPLASGLASFAIVAHVSSRAGQASLSILRLPPLIYLGTVSYGLYLYHLPVMYFVRNFIPPSGRAGILGDALALLASLLLATISWFLIERPILMLKERFTYRQASDGSNSCALASPRPIPSLADGPAPRSFSPGP